jgi:hypothetical protein
MPSPHCDRLTVTVPRSHDAALRDVQAETGLMLSATPSPKIPGLWVLPEGGTLLYTVRPGFAMLEASGRALTALRAAHVFGDYLSALGALPHRVSRLDAALDIPIRSAPELHRIYALGKGGMISLSRKRLQPTEVGQWFSPALYPDEPLDTGSVYLPKKAEGTKRQYATVYDKRQERLARGYPDPGPLLRLEAVAARGKGATLGDAWDPTGIFWDIIAPDIWPCPPDTPAWASGAHPWVGEGLVPTSVAVRLDRYLEGPAGAELVRLAGFPSGLAVIRAWIDRVEAGLHLAGGSSAAPPPASEPAPSPAPDSTPGRTVGLEPPAPLKPLKRRRRHPRAV